MSEDVNRMNAIRALAERRVALHTEDIREHVCTERDLDISVHTARRPAKFQLLHQNRDAQYVTPNGC